ncbi:MAG: HAMP domain-containing histidine kinase [Thermoproteota archaeon]|nr:HAMP domain-containing histidine kinase [Thermoproteota archaeon]
MESGKNDDGNPHNLSSKPKPTPSLALPTGGNNFPSSSPSFASLTPANTIKEEKSQFERTEIWHGQEMAMNGLVECMSRVKSKADVVGDHLSPSFSMGVEQIKSGYVDFKSRNVKIRFITEIIKDNLPYCKELMQYVELRHMDGVKGNMAISETEYVATANLEGEAKPVTQTIYSNVKAIIEQHRYFFENLWNKALPAEQRIREIEEGLLPVETRVLRDPQEIFTNVIGIAEKTNKGLSNCSTIGGLHLIYNNEHFIKAYKSLLKRHKEGKVREGIRWLTFIEDKQEHVDLVKEFLELGVSIRHVNNLPPLYFALTEKNFQGTVEKMEKGKMFENLLYSTEPLYIKHFESLFEEIWKNGIDAEYRISQIEKGIASERTELIENPQRTKTFFLQLIKKASDEIMIVFPSYKAAERQDKIGVIGLLNQKGKEKARVRILSPNKDDVKGLLDASENIPSTVSKENDHKAEGIDIREIVKQQDIKTTILMVDRKHLLSIELKDDSKDSFEEAIGLATYSTSKPTVLSNISIFESLWSQTELLDNLKEANEKLEIQDRMQKDFINVAAHELRTPSQAILGYAELALLDYNSSEKNQNAEYMERIVRNAERLSRLIGNILSVARIENKSLSLNKKSFDIEELIEDIIEEVRSRVGKISHKQTEISFKKASYNPAEQGSSYTTINKNKTNNLLVNADKESIEQVIINLLDNAVKFSERIEVKLRKGKSEAIVEISDNGPGIDKETLPHMFKKFMTKSSSGTGLGLFISKSIIESHNGHIWAENNKEGKGATFGFSLPIVKT